MSMKRRDFILSVSAMWVLAVLSGIESERIAYEGSLTGEKVNLNKLKKEVERGNISFKEAMFYEVLEEKNS